MSKSNETVFQLTVRKDWKIPTILQTQLSAEDNENIIEVGCRIFKESKDVSTSLCEKELHNKITKNADMKIENVRKEYEEKEETFTREIENLKEELKSSEHNKLEQEEKYKGRISVLSSRLKSTKETINDEIMGVKESYHEEKELLRKEMEIVMVRLKEQNKKLTNDIEEEKQKSWNEKKTIEKETCDEKKAIEKENNARIDKISHNEQQTRKAEREMWEKRSEKLQKVIDAERERCHALQTRHAVSAVKGSDNEKDFADLLVNTFGQTRNFENLPKKHNSGDHLIMWEGYKLMFENKIGLNKSQLKSAKGLKKAHDDFQRNTDCDALIFVSEDTPIPGHERPSNIDLSIIDNRPVIYIGRFSEVPDKLSYINSMLIPTLDILLRMYKKTNIDTSVEKEALQGRLSQISRLYSNFNGKLTSINNEICAFDRQQKAGILRLKDVYKSVSNDFKSMLDIVTYNEFVEPENNTDNKSDSTSIIENNTTPIIENNTTSNIENPELEPDNNPIIENNSKIKPDETPIIDDKIQFKTKCGKGGKNGVYVFEKSYNNHVLGCAKCKK